MLQAEWAAAIQWLQLLNELIIHVIWQLRKQIAQAHHSRLDACVAAIELAARREAREAHKIAANVA